jgi:hypothetical protein
MLLIEDCHRFFMVEMLIEIPEVRELRGEGAVKALSSVIAELKAQKEKKLTDPQAEALLKIAKGMISSIQEEEKTKPKRKAKWSLFSRKNDQGPPKS